MNNTESNVVIVGASHAAAEAISSLRKAGWAGRITLIGDEPELPYQRPPLSKAYYKGEVSIEKLSIKNTDFYRNADVELYLGKTVKSINRKDKEVELLSGEKISYTKLILATGTRARHIPVEGADLDCVAYLRTVKDVDSIKKKVGANGKLLIVGAGYIGLEVAASAIQQNIEVTILEAQSRVLARVSGEEISEFFQDIHKNAGVDIRLNANLKWFVRADNEYFAELESGEKIQFDCAIVGIGVIPNIELAEQAGLACDNGILVDEYTRTDDHDIYAIGDCSNHPSPLYQRRVRLESVPNAVAQAKTAALSICGTNRAYDQLPWFWSDQYDVKLQTAGLLQDYDESVVEGDIEGHKFTVWYFKKGELIALDAINSPGEFLRAKKRLTETLASNR